MKPRMNEAPAPMLRRFCRLRRPACSRPSGRNSVMISPVDEIGIRNIRETAGRDIRMVNLRKYDWSKAISLFE